MNIRIEQPKDYREVENLTREAFWNIYRPGCTEHYVLHKYRENPDFIPELDFVMEEDGKIIGHVMYSKATIVREDGGILPAWTFGPISILPEYKRQGYGLKLLTYSIEKAREMGIGVLCMEGKIGFYKHAGFVVASTLKIHYHGEPKDSDVPYFLAQEIIPGYLNGIEGTYMTPKGYFAADENPEDFEEFEATFPAKEKDFNDEQLPQFCQSCGMPLSRKENCGTNTDGSVNFDYCKYCYNNGKFIQDCTMEGMIEHCAQFVDEMNKHLATPVTQEQYKDQMEAEEDNQRLREENERLSVANAKQADDLAYTRGQLDKASSVKAFANLKAVIGFEDKLPTWGLGGDFGLRFKSGLMLSAGATYGAFGFKYGFRIS